MSTSGTMVDGVVIRKVKHYGEVQEMLDELKVKDKVKGRVVVIKPNLTLSRPPPTTTNVKLVKELVRYFKNDAAKVIVGEASGGCDTKVCFKKLGYEKLASEEGIEIVDFNEAEVVEKRNDACFTLKDFPMPKVLEGSFLVSVAVLKHHSAASVTLGLKNMMGIAPGRFFSSTPWNKAAFHELGLDECIVDVNLHRAPDLTVIDGTVAQLGAEIVGVAKRFDTLIAGYDPVACDSVGAKILGFNPREVRHIRLAEGKGLGRALNVGVEGVSLSPFVYRAISVPFSVLWCTLSYVRRKLTGVA